MRLGISTKVTATLVVLLGFGLGLVAYLDDAKFQKTLADLQAGRVEVVGHQIVGAIENGMNLGLALDQITNLDTILRRGARGDGDIQSVLVLDERGRVLVASDGRPVGMPLPGALDARTADGRSQGWRGRSAAAFVVGLPIVNTFGGHAGNVVVTYDTAPFDAAVAAVRPRLLETLGLVLAVSAALGGIGVLLAFRALRRTLSEASDLLDHAEATPRAPASAMTDGIAGFLERAGLLEQELDAAERELETARRTSEAALIRRRLEVAS